MGLRTTADTLAIELAEGQLFKSMPKGLLSAKPPAIRSEQRQLSVTGRTGQRHTVELFQECTSSPPWPSLCEGPPTQAPWQRPGQVAGWESLEQEVNWVVHSRADSDKRAPGSLL